MFGAPVKSGPTSGPLTVSSQRDPAAPRHRPAGAVHLGAVEAGVRPDDLAEAGHLDGRGRRPGPSGRRPCSRRRTPAPGRSSRGCGPAGSCRRRPRNAPMPSCRPGSLVPSSRIHRGTRCRGTTGTGNPSGNHSRTMPSRRSGMARRVFWRSRPFALAAIAVNPWNGPPTAMAVAAPAAPCRNRRRSMLGIGRSSRTPREAAESTPPERLMPGRSGRPNLRCAAVGLRFVDSRAEMVEPKPHTPAPDQRGRRAPTADGANGMGTRHAPSRCRTAPRRGACRCAADPEGNEFDVIEPGNNFLAGWGFLGELAVRGHP